MTTVNIHIGDDDNVLADLIRRMETMQQAIEDLTAAVAHNSTVTASAAALIQGLADQIDAAAGDEEAVRALAGDIRSAADQLSAAVMENTPSAEEPTEPEVPEEPTGPV